MRFFAIPLLLLALGMGGSHSDATRVPSETMTLFDFNTADEALWQVVNDGVMGGRSEGFVTIRDGMLRFTGTLVTRGGGFTSVRSDRSVDLAGYDGLELRVRGSGRVFEVGIDDGTRRGRRMVARRAPFNTEADWVRVRVPFNSLGTTVFGQIVSAPPIDLTNVERISLYILDRQDGPFLLEVDSISAYRIESE